MAAEYSTEDTLPYVLFNSVTEQDEKPFGWNDEHRKNTWNDRYMARKVVFPDGQLEVTVSREKHFLGPALISNKRAARGESENRERNDEVAGRAAKKRVRQACKSIGADRMITLTYRDNMTNRETALKHWDRFRRRMGKHKQFHYVAVIEEQKRGALHFHVAVRGRQCYQLLRSIWSNVVGLDEHGRSMSNVDVRNPRKLGFGAIGIHKLAAYLAKYCAKEMDCRSLDQKRYFCSRGIAKPLVHEWPLGCNKSIDAVRTAFFIAGHGLLDGAQFWYNKALDVIWIATAPSTNDPSFDDVPF